VIAACRPALSRISVADVSRKKLQPKVLKPFDESLFQKTLMR